MKSRLFAVVLIAVVIFGLMAASKARHKIKPVKDAQQIQQELGIPIQTGTVQVGRIDDTIPVTGNITALDTVILSPKIAGKVAFIALREGDVVRRGQVVARLDSTDADSLVRQARASLEGAMARLSQANTTVSVTEVQSSAAISQAQAALASVTANLQKVKKGARSQEKMIAENQVATAKANHDNAQANLRRMKQLFGQGAISQAQLDVAQTQYDVAKAQYDSAKQNLSLVEEGARSEDVRVAELAVAQAEEAVRTAKANAGQNALRREDVKNAQAGVQQAKATLSIAQEQVKNCNIVSSIDGIVSKRLSEPGQTCPAGGAVLEVVSVKSVFFQANVSETVLSKVKTGQAVTVSVDAYPGATFNGTVEKIYPTAATNTRNFSVRIRIPNSHSELKPGMFARGSIVAATNTGVLLVPQDAVEDRNGETMVFIVNDGKVKPCSVKKGLSNAELVEILPPTDLSAGDTVATSGRENLQDGSKVNVGSAKRASVPKH